jgi:hypothetical protein
LLLQTADGPGMTTLNGLVGHHGVYGCRLYCPLKGRRKDGKPHYYPVLKRPTNYNLSGLPRCTAIQNGTDSSQVVAIQMSMPRIYHSPLKKNISRISPTSLNLKTKLSTNGAKKQVYPDRVCLAAFYANTGWEYLSVVQEILCTGQA